ncbi:MAG: hypothetical protein Q8Q94_04395 [bacterium]|nr:hypothetical protein [bacterium]
MESDHKAIHPLLWDIAEDDLDETRHSTTIIERVLEYGNEVQVAWLFKRYSRSAIITVVKKSRRLSKKSKNYWYLKLGLWSTPPRSAEPHATIWKN